jgi:two-component system cell cycle response regulator
MQSALNIMLVDGSHASRDILRKALKAELPDANILSMNTGLEALVHAANTRFDLITTALLMPDMDGLEFAQRIRAIPLNQRTPLVVVSGDADWRLLSESYAAGITGYLDKAQGYRAIASYLHAIARSAPGLVGRVLYVEDSLTAATAVRRVLEREGLEVTHTTRAETALDLLAESVDREGRSSFDIIITDFRYLDGPMSGADLIREVRARFHYQSQELPILVITVQDSDLGMVEVLHSGANDFLHKPVVEDILVARVRSLLTIKRQFEALGGPRRQPQHHAH